MGCRARRRCRQISGVSLMLGVLRGVEEGALEGKETLKRLRVMETCRLGLQSRCEEEDSTASVI